MNEPKYIERELEDQLIREGCLRCCISCKKYKTVKEQREKCQPLKARTRSYKREFKFKGQVLGAEEIINDRDNCKV